MPFPTELILVSTFQQMMALCLSSSCSSTLPVFRILYLSCNSPQLSSLAPDLRNPLLLLLQSLYFSGSILPEPHSTVVFSNLVTPVSLSYHLVAQKSVFPLCFSVGTFSKGEPTFPGAQSCSELCASTPCQPWASEQCISAH